MSKIETGGPAFPGLNPEMTGIDSDGTERWETEPSGGMTLRDYFAAKAMQGLIASPRGTPGGRDATDAYYAKMAYVMADAMLEARK